MTHPQYLRLQVDVGQRHLSDLVEADGQWDSTEDEEAVIDGDPHQNDGLHISGSRLNQQGTDKIYYQEEEADAKEKQVQRKSGRQEQEFWINTGPSNSLSQILLWWHYLYCRSTGDSLDLALK